MSDGKLFALRFDVDTHRCVREGVPNLLDLGRDLGVRFTFFVNMGRAVDHRATWRAFWDAPPEKPSTTAKLSARRKLGLGGYLTAAVANPRVGAGAPEVVTRAVDEGHDVGLHGGTNHATWQAEATEWSEDDFAKEVAAGLKMFRDVCDAHPRGFSSPGWQGPPALLPVLERHGFDFVADRHGPHGELEPAAEGSSVISIPTQLAGEPDGVAYLEHGRARGMSTDEILAQFTSDLPAAGDRVVAYDHPYHAGIHELDVLAQMVRIARDAGYSICTLSDIVDSVRDVA